MDSLLDAGWEWHLISSTGPRVKKGAFPGAQVSKQEPSFAVQVPLPLPLHDMLENDRAEAIANIGEDVSRNEIVLMKKCRAMKAHNYYPEEKDRGSSISSDNLTSHSLDSLHKTKLELKPSRHNEYYFEH